MNNTPFSVHALRERPHLGTTSLGSTPRVPTSDDGRVSMRRRLRRRRTH